MIVSDCRDSVQVTFPGERMLPGRCPPLQGYGRTTSDRQPGYLHDLSALCMIFVRRLFNFISLPAINTILNPSVNLEQNLNDVFLAGR